MTGTGTSVATRGGDPPHATDDDSNDQLWSAYKVGGSGDAREQLILRYVPLVKQVASRWAAQLPSSVDVSDLVSYGIIGLIDAIGRFEPERGLRFETYAVRRISGAIVDELRALDWAPRRLRAQARKLRLAESRLSLRLGRMPTRDELAVELGIQPAQLEVLRTRIEIARVSSINELLEGGERGSAEGASVGESIPDPVDLIGRVDTVDGLAHAMGTLSERERLVVMLSFDQQVTLKKIGEDLRLTESRVCQIRSEALAKLRDQLRIAESGWGQRPGTSLESGDAT